MLDTVLACPQDPHAAPLPSLFMPRGQCPAVSPLLSRSLPPSLRDAMPSVGSQTHALSQPASLSPDITSPPRCLRAAPDLGGLERGPVLPPRVPQAAFPSQHLPPSACSFSETPPATPPASRRVLRASAVVCGALAASPLGPHRLLLSSHAGPWLLPMHTGHLPP